MLGVVNLPPSLAPFAPVMSRFGYVAVAVLIFLESFGFPLPGETVLIAAAVYAGTGHLNVFIVGGAAWVATFAGSTVGFVVGRVGGEPLVLRWGRRFFLTPERLDRVARFFRKGGAWCVLGARFVEGFRQFNGIVAGVCGMPWPLFLAANAVGAALWVTAWTSVGVLAGNHLGTILVWFGRFELLVIALIVVLVAAWIAHRRWRRDVTKS